MQGQSETPPEGFDYAAAKRAADNAKRWTITGRTSGPPGSLQGLALSVKGPQLAANTPVEVVPLSFAEELSTGLEKCEEDLNREILRCKGLEEGLRREVERDRAIYEQWKAGTLDLTPELARNHRTRATRLEALLPQPMDGGDE